MNKKIFYLCPQEEGKQEFVCWGFKLAEVDDSHQAVIKEAVMAGLKEIQMLEDRWYRERSFSVLFGQEKAHFWVAIPRNLATKMIAIMNAQLSALPFAMKKVITSYNNSFDYTCPFYHVISYDRGFVYDASALEDQMMAFHEQTLQVVNG